jgi:hypothetical protein
MIFINATSMIAAALVLFLFLNPNPEDLGLEVFEESLDEVRQNLILQ